MKVIDLTCKIRESMYVYPGEPKPKIRQFRTIEKDGFAEKELTIVTHHSTHMDAQSHKFAKGRSLDKEPASKFINDALKIDLPGAESIGKKDIVKFANEISSVKALVLHTGYGKKILNGSAGADFPYLGKDAAEFLSQFGLNVLGIDSPSMDAAPAGAVHEILLPKGIIFLETLVNLSKVPSRFRLIALPLLIEDSDGAPCRAVAVFD